MRNIIYRNNNYKIMVILILYDFISSNDVHFVTVYITINRGFWIVITVPFGVF